jgi:hypothetical protein
MEPQDVGLLVEAGVADSQRLLNVTGLMAVFDAIERNAEAVSDLSNAVELVSHGLLLRLLRAIGMYDRGLIFLRPRRRKSSAGRKLLAVLDQRRVRPGYYWDSHTPPTNALKCRAAQGLACER